VFFFVYVLLYDRISMTKKNLRYNILFFAHTLSNVRSFASIYFHKDNDYQVIIPRVSFVYIRYKLFI
jgi:hypothetical protein